jgi:DNA repair protein RadB
MNGILWLVGLDRVGDYLTTKFLSPIAFTPFMKDITFSTGTSVFDRFLQGYEAGVVTTVYGPSGSGKTTVCLLATIGMLQNDKKVIYVDCEGGFSGARFSQLVGGNEQELLDRLFLLKPLSFADQVKAIHRLRDLVNESIGLIVVDSISMLYRVALHNREGHRSANAELSTQVAHLVEVARRYSIPVLLTSQVYADFDERDKVKMVGGDILRYGSKCLLQLEKYKSVRKVSIVKHRSLPEATHALFTIVEKGFEAFEEGGVVPEVREETLESDVPGFVEAGE